MWGEYCRSGGRRFIGGRRAAASSSTSTPDPRVHTCFHGVGLPPSTLKKGQQEATTDIPGIPLGAKCILTPERVGGEGAWKLATHWSETEFCELAETPVRQSNFTTLRVNRGRIRSAVEGPAVIERRLAAQVQKCRQTAAELQGAETPSTSECLPIDRTSFKESGSFSSGTCSRPLPARTSR